MNETQFKKKVEQFLKDEGIWYVKYWAGIAKDGNNYTKSGIPDVIACVHGHFFGIELKVHPNKPTKLQEYNIRKIEESDGIAMVLYPEDFETFKNLCRRIQPTVKTESKRFPIDIQKPSNKERK